MNYKWEQGLPSLGRALVSHTGGEKEREREGERGSQMSLKYIPGQGENKAQAYMYVQANMGEQ